MIPLSDIIRSMSLEEQGKFVSFLKKKKAESRFSKT